ncbi:MAG: hypothetical protein OJJ21_15170 [Ferrovibrio sp.]|uniref:hypothetical protein n=1 Tax=Ferrovibrio sp. TaxID=1917215 RepID=UPI0026313230|nr:hypothetical protein [Ferrovibrio sp.]MCW0234940.1 hypothetical protein [Ferrovibrio sp.]
MNIMSADQPLHRGPPLKFIHVGHHKCGSTFLQYEVLPKIHALRQPSGKQPDGTSDLRFRRAWISLASQGDGGFDIEAVAREFSRKDFNCLSNEAFSGYGSIAAATGSHAPLAAQRLHRIFGDVPVLIVIRNQRSIVQSLYMDDVEYGYVADFEAWARHRHFHNMLDWFRYAPLIEAYQTAFGQQRVHVITAEDLYRRETIEAVLQRFDIPSDGLDAVDFGRRVNDSPCGPVVWLTRQLFRRIGTPANMGRGMVYNFWIDHARWTLDRLLRQAGAARAEYNFLGYEDILRETFHADNLRVTALTGLDLTVHNYP